MLLLCQRRECGQRGVRVRTAVILLGLRRGRRHRRRLRRRGRSVGVVGGLRHRLQFAEKLREVECRERRRGRRRRVRRRLLVQGGHLSCDHRASSSSRPRFSKPRANGPLIAKCLIWTTTREICGASGASGGQTVPGTAWQSLPLLRRGPVARVRQKLPAPARMARQNLPPRVVRATRARKNFPEFERHRRPAARGTPIASKGVDREAARSSPRRNRQNVQHHPRRRHAAEPAGVCRTSTPSSAPRRTRWPPASPFRAPLTTPLSSSRASRSINRANDLSTRKDSIDQGISVGHHGDPGHPERDHRPAAAARHRAVGEDARPRPSGPRRRPSSPLWRHSSNQLLNDSSYQGLNLVELDRVEPDAAVQRQHVLDAEGQRPEPADQQGRHRQASAGERSRPPLSSARRSRRSRNSTSKFDVGLQRLATPPCRTFQAAAQTLGSNVSFLQTRLGFTEQYITTLQGGASKLTVADVNLGEHEPRHLADEAAARHSVAVDRDPVRAVRALRLFH